MHPLAKALDASLHDNRHFAAAQRRRSSLDNSCLSAHETLRILLNDEEAFERARPRRLSLNHENRITVTFMAQSGASGHRKDGDLDLDHHVETIAKGMPKCFDNSATISLEESEQQAADGSDSSMDSDCDTFCDASFQEPANKEYLQQDLGASCFWEMSVLDMECETTEAVHYMPDTITEDDLSSSECDFDDPMVKSAAATAPDACESPSNAARTVMSSPSSSSYSSPRHVCSDSDMQFEESSGSGEQDPCITVQTEQQVARPMKSRRMSFRKFLIRKVSGH